jgi:hypothetical protein
VDVPLYLPFDLAAVRRTVTVELVPGAAVHRQYCQEEDDRDERIALKQLAIHCRVRLAERWDRITPKNRWVMPAQALRRARARGYNS